jgi:hypothetical protein
MRILSSILGHQFEHFLNNENEFTATNAMMYYYLDLRKLPIGNGSPFIINLPTPPKEEIILPEGHEYPEGFRDFYSQFSGKRFRNEEIRVTMILEGGRDVIIKPGFKIFESTAPLESNLMDIFTRKDGLPIIVSLLYFIDSYVLESAFPESKDFDRYINFNRLSSTRLDTIAN